MSWYLKRSKHFNISFRNLLLSQTTPNPLTIPKPGPISYSQDSVFAQFSTKLYGSKPRVLNSCRNPPFKHQNRCQNSIFGTFSTRFYSSKPGFFSSSLNSLSALSKYRNCSQNSIFGSFSKRFCDSKRGFFSSSVNSPFSLPKPRNLCRNSTFGNSSRRYYYVDHNQIRHFKPRGFKRWLENPRYVFAVVVIGAGVGITVYFGHLETVPYTKRKHFVLLSKNAELQLGELQFRNLKEGFKGKILPAIHPASVRVRMISKDIIEALQRGLRKEQVWTDLGYANMVDSDGGHQGKAHEALTILSENAEGGRAEWHKEDEVLLDDKWVEKSRKKQKGAESATSHLENFKWEVLVVNKPIVNAFCLPGGKIVVFTGLLEHFRSDAEIATIIGHEVAHAVARHSAEQITKNLWFTIVQLILYQYAAPDLVNSMSNLLLRLPFSRRMEIEADYIGLLLMASAGYDPRVAPLVFEKLGKIAGDSALLDYLSTHPSGRKRAKLLSEAKVMQEALAIYREAMGGREVEGFFL